MKANLSRMPDDRLKRFYEDIRQQVAADKANKHKFTAGQGVRDYADELQRELIRRGLPYSPVNWPTGLAE